MFLLNYFNFIHILWIVTYAQFTKYHEIIVPIIAIFIMIAMIINLFIIIKFIYNFIINRKMFNKKNIFWPSISLLIYLLICWLYIIFVEVSASV